MAKSKEDIIYLTELYLDGKQFDHHIWCYSLIDRPVGSSGCSCIQIRKTLETWKKAERRV